jgi:cysteine desulfurase
MDHSIYLDYCATSPLHPEVRVGMLEALDGAFGNPSSMHWAGREAARLVDRARNQVASSLGCQPEEIHFTSGATEADNLALLGILRAGIQAKSRRQVHLPQRPHLITSAIEHHAILHTAQQLEREGFPVTILPVNSQGLVDPEDFRKAIRPNTALVSVMLVNNEVGSVQPVAKIGKIARAAGILVHTDAVQGMGLLDVNVDELNVDMLSLSAHKIYGPKGIGALYIRAGTPFYPLMYGGPQEGGLRPGTENVPGIVGLGLATALVSRDKSREHSRLSQLRQVLVDGLSQRLPSVRINGSPKDISPHILSVSFPKADGEMMLVRLNRAGVAVSLGSACTSKSIEPSHVLSAMGLSQEQIEGTLRISIGIPTTLSEIETLLDLIPDIYRRAGTN